MASATAYRTLHSGARLLSSHTRLARQNGVVVRHQSSFSPMDWWRNRQESQHAEKYKERLIEMASSERWLLSDMKKELSEVTNSWSAKMPGLSSQKEIKAAKELDVVVSALMEVCGEDTDAERLKRMDRKEKLQSAVKAGVTIEDINRTVEQFQMTDLMHRALRRCKEKGMPIPSSQEGIQTLIQSQGILLLSKDQKNKLGKEHAKKMMRRRS